MIKVSAAKKKKGLSILDDIKGDEATARQEAIEASQDDLAYPDVELSEGDQIWGTTELPDGTLQ